MKIGSYKLTLPLKVVWLVIAVTILPDVLNVFGFDFGSIDFIWKSFIHNSLEIVSISTAFLIVFISLIDFKIKGDVSTPLVAITMLCSGCMDLVHVLASNNLILQEYHLTFITIYTWSVSRTFNALILLLGAGMFLIQSDNLFKNVKMHNKKLIWYAASLFLIITIVYITMVMNLGKDWEQRLMPYVFQRKIDLIPLVLYLFALTIIFPKFYTNRPSTFSQTLLLSLVPSVAAQLHLVLGSGLPFENNAMIAYYLKLISYIIPFAGIALNYLQTHYNEVVAIQRYKSESGQKNALNSLLEGIMDVSPNGILVFEAVRNPSSEIQDFKCVLRNNAANVLSKEGVPQGTLYSHIFPDQPALHAMYRRLVTEGGVVSREVYDESRNKWLKITAVKYRDGFVKNISDITDIKIAGEKIRKREELLSQAEKVARFGSWEWDIDKDRVIWSDELCALYGYPPEENEQSFESTFELVHPEDISKLKLAFAEAINNHQDFEIEYRRYSKDGELKHLYMKCKVFTGKENSVVRMLGVNIDMTMQKLVRTTLRHNEILYRTIASNMPDTEVVLFDTNYRIILADGNLKNPLLKNKLSLMSKDIREVMEPFRLDLSITSILTGTTGERSVQYREIKGRYFLVHQISIPGPEGDVISGMILIQDITEIKRAELSLETKVQDLDRSNKELEHFAYVASHDLQEPLRKITAFGDRLKMKFKDVLSEDGIDYINRMTDATTRMQRLITDLLAFSRITRIQEPFQPVDLNLLVKDILSDIEMKIISTGATVNFDKLPVIEAVPSQMQQLLQNLLLNSLKFQQKEVRPVITISCEIIDSQQAKMKSGQEYVRITVKDNGIGFNQKYADRIFALFQRLHGRSDYEGTGIGLALCKKITEFHHGRIYARGEENQGAEFIVILPISQPEKDDNPVFTENYIKNN